MLITPALLLVIALQATILGYFARPHARWVIVGIHLVLLVTLFFAHGVAMDKEAIKYIGCAQDVVQGDFSDLTGNYLKYASYVLFLLPFVAIGSLTLAVVAQVILGILAAFALGRLAQRISGSGCIGNLAVAILLLCVPVQIWTLALYTESFFTSVTVLFLERVMRNERADGWAYLLALLVVFARPVGILFVGPALIWKWTQGLAPGLRSTVRAVGYPAVILVAVLIPGIERAQLAPIVEAQVIAGVPGTPGAMDEFQGSSIADAQRYLVQHHSAGEWVELTVQRMASLFTLHRPWYSMGHNLAVGLNYLLYPLALLGLWRYRSDPVVRLITAMLLLQTLLVGLTHDEWSGRFLVPLIPLVILLATLGIGALGPKSRSTQ